MGQDWCPRCAAPLKSATFGQLLEADEALRAYRRSYDALAAGWTQWGERRQLLVDELAAQRYRTPVPSEEPIAAQPETEGTEPADMPPVPVTPLAPDMPAVATSPAGTESPEAEAEAEAEAEPDQAQAAAFETPGAAPSPASAPEPARASAAHAAAPAPARTATSTAPPVQRHRPPAQPARKPRRRMSEVFTAPVLLGVSGASLMIAAAIVAVAITWATATPVVRGVLVLIVAGGVGALAVWLRRLHLVITSGSVGIVAMGFAGTSAVAFLSESPALSPYSAAVAFLLAGAAGIALARLKLAWVGPSAAIALTGFVVALTITVTSQTADAGAIWAWSVTGVVTAFALAATSVLWPWRSAHHIAGWAGLSWVGIVGVVAAMWLWFGDVTLTGAFASVVPIAALAWLSRSERATVAATATVTTAALVTIVGPGFAFIAQATPWQQITVLAGTIAAVVVVGARLPALMRRHVLAGLLPGYALAWAVAVSFAGAGLSQRGELMVNPAAESADVFTFDVWVGLAPALLAIAVATLRTWNLAELKISGGLQQIVVMSGPLAGITAIMVLTVTISDLIVHEWVAWVWVVVAIALALAFAASRKVWQWELAQRIAMWGAVLWVAMAGVVVAVWSWSGDVTLVGSLAGLLPIAALVVVVRWLPRTSVIMATALTTAVAASIGFVAGLTPWQQVAVVSVVIALAVVVGVGLSRLRQGAVAIGLAPAFVVVVVGTGGYTIAALVTGVIQAMTGSLSAQGFYESTPGTIDVWAGVAALLAGLAVAGVRLWRLGETGRDVTGWRRAGGVVGALVIAAGVTILATAVADMAAGNRAHVALASALSVAAVVLLLARVLWADRVVKNVSSGFAVALAGLAGVHGVWGLAIGEMSVLAGLGVALAPVAILAVWGHKRPAEGTGLATLLATAAAAALAGALGATPTLALAVAVALAAAMAWVVRLLPGPQREMVLIGASPALGWGLIAGLWTGFEAVQWLDTARWTPHGWVAITALTAAVGLAALRTGPWRSGRPVFELIGALLALAAAPVALAAGADAIGLNEPAFALGSALVGAIVAAAGLAWWRDRAARRLTRIGAVAWVAAAGIMGWLNVVFSSWDITTTLVLSVAALALLVAASRWWPRAALAPAALLLVAAPAALVARAEWPPVALGVAMLVGVVLVALVLFLVPVRLRVIGLIGALPALIAGAVWVVMAVLAGAAEAVTGGRAGQALENHWWALGLVVTLGAAVVVIGRLGMGRGVRVAVDISLALSLVGGVIVATAVLAKLAAPDTPGDQARLLLAPAVAALMGAAVVVWTMRHERALGGNSGGAGTPPAAVRSLGPAIARHGVMFWVMVLGVAVLAWVVREDVHWLAGVGVVLALAAGLAVAGIRWPYLGLVPAVALVTVSPYVVVPVTLEARFAASACLAAVLVAAGVWGARLVTSTKRQAVWIGLIPASLGVVVSLVFALLVTVSALMGRFVAAGWLGSQRTVEVLTWWQVGVVAASAVAVLAWRGAQQFRGWVLLSALVVTGAALPPIWAVVLLSVTALTLLFAGKWLRTGSVAAGVAVGIAMVWSVGSDGALGVTAATATVIAVTVALGWRTRSLTWGAVVAPVTALIAGVFIARALDATQVAVPAGVGLSMVIVLVLVSADRERLRMPVAYMAIPVTVLAPLFAGSAAMMGLAFVLGAATWWRLFSAGLTWARWMCAATASFGTAALLASINIQVIEAYTAVPALALLLIGVQWLRDKPELRSVTALSPGLAAALVPSYLALVLEPDEIWRTIALIGAVIVLALVGLRLRWFAPILATAVTAVVLSVLQFIAGGNLVVRLIAFAVVGALLLGIASFFEKLKELR